MLGEDPQQAGRGWRERIGIVLQSCRLDPYLTVRESLGLYAGYYRAPRPVEEVIELVGLGGKADERARRLSGGQQRRLDVGMALIGDPELLFLDEPTTGFDPSARRQAWDVIAGLRELGKTVFLTTHYMDEAQRLADRVTIIAARRDRRPRHPRGPRRPREPAGDDQLPGRRRARSRWRRRRRSQTLHELTGRGAGRGRGARGPGSDAAHPRGRLPGADRSRGGRSERPRPRHQFRYDQKAFWRNPASVFFTVMFPVDPAADLRHRLRRPDGRRAAAGSRRRPTTCRRSSPSR